MQRKPKKNLFLTGPMGCGKSTSIAAALAQRLPAAGGFLTLRQRDDTGRAVAFWLQSCDAGLRQCFLDCSVNRSAMHMEVFETFGVQLLQEARRSDFVVLDEIGGFEVLSEAFMEALLALLESEIPCIGVIKGAGPAGKLIQSLGLGEAYEQEADALRNWMERDENTLVYECGQFDPEGLRLAQDWVMKYCRT